MISQNWSKHVVYTTEAGLFGILNGTEGVKMPIYLYKPLQLKVPNSLPLNCLKHLSSLTHFYAESHFTATPRDTTPPPEKPLFSQIMLGSGRKMA